MYRFYSKQLYKNWAVLIPVLLLFLFVIFTYSINQKRSEYNDLSFQVNFEYDSMVEAKKQTLKTKSFKTEKEKQSYVTFMDEKMAGNRELARAIKRGDWKKVAKLRKKSLQEAILDSRKTGSKTDEIVRTNGLEEIARLEQIERHDLAPDVKDMETQGINFIFRFLSSYFPTILLVVILICSLFFTQNYKQDLDIDLLVPEHPVVGVLRKIGFLLVATLVIYVSCLFLGAVLGSFWDRLGSFSYPINLFSEEHTRTKAVGILLQQLVTLNGLSLLCVIVTVFLFSKVTRHTVMTFLFSVLFCIGVPLFLERTVPLYKVAHLLPFTYFNSGEVLVGKFAVEMQNRQVDFLTGTVILSGTSLVGGIVLCMSSFLSFEKILINFSFLGRQKH